jgi:hypothetical protein
MSDRHANHRDSICCDSIGCCAIPVLYASRSLGCSRGLRGCRANRLTSAVGMLSGAFRSAPSPIRFVSLRESIAYSRCPSSSPDTAETNVVTSASITSASTVPAPAARWFDRAFDCVHVSASDRRFNRRRSAARFVGAPALRLVGAPALRLVGAPAPRELSASHPVGASRCFASLAG